MAPGIMHAIYNAVHRLPHAHPRAHPHAHPHAHPRAHPHAHPRAHPRAHPVSYAYPINGLLPRVLRATNPRSLQVLSEGPPTFTSQDMPSRPSVAQGEVAILTRVE